MKGFFFCASLSTDTLERKDTVMVDIIYMDIDGTLRDEIKGVPQSIKQVINQCHEQQIKVVLCTGRNMGSIQDDVLALPVDGIISGGGCYIQYKNHDFWKKHFSKETIDKVMKITFNHKLSLALEAEQKIYMDCNTAGFYKQDFQRKMELMEDTEHQGEVCKKHKIIYEDNFREFKNNRSEIHKICILGQKKGVNRAESILKGEVEIVQKKMWNNQWYLELLPKGCDKGKAVTFLNDELGVAQRRTISFGDSENDIPMMKATGTAIAVESGNTKIKKYASSVCEAVMEDGIYKELVRRNIIK